MTAPMTVRCVFANDCANDGESWSQDCANDCAWALQKSILHGINWRTHERVCARVSCKSVEARNAPRIAEGSFLGLWDERGP